MTKIGLERNLEKNDLIAEKIKEGIGLDTNLEMFSRILWREIYPKIKGRKSKAPRLAMCMLGYLRKGNIHTIRDLYSLKKKEILYYRGYGRKTWVSLNKILKHFGLPPLNLPTEYTS